MPKDSCYTVAFDAAAEEALQEAMSLANCGTVPDLIKSALACFIDLLDVEDRRLAIIFRDGATGSEWSYSPRKPGRALAAMPDGAEGGFASVPPSPVVSAKSSRLQSEGLAPSTGNVHHLPTSVTRPLR